MICEDSERWMERHLLVANTSLDLRSSRQEHLATASQLAAARLEIERLEIELRAVVKIARRTVEALHSLRQEMVTL